MTHTLLLASVIATTILAQERPPAGDIPDTQSFVTYIGKGYRVEIP